MNIVPIVDVGSIGIIKDVPFDELPLAAWTDGRNVRFRDGAVEKFSGHSEVFATPLWAPYWLLPVFRGGNYFWLYASTTKVGATDGATHADITRIAGDYTTNLDIGWTGTIIEDIPVINNGTDVPQMWNAPALATDLIALTGWNAAWRANTMRGLKRYLVAMDVTKSGIRYPTMIKWSHEAPTGNVPTTWDETDPALDAGEFTLPATGGFLIDGCPIRDQLMLLLEFQTWLMTFTGGTEVFRFAKKFDTVGSLTRRCSVEFFSGRMAIFTGDDLVLTDAQEAKSLLNRKDRIMLANTIDSTYHKRSFVAANYAKFEIWLCYPEIGNQLPNKAIVWNWQEDTISWRDLPSVAYAVAGIVNPVDAAEVWSGAVGVWETDSASWGDRSFDPGRRSLLMAAPLVTKLLQADQTAQASGENITSYVERRGIGFPLKRDRPPDYSRMKQVLGLFPRISGTAGGIVSVYIAPMSRADATPVYGAARPYVIGSSDFIDTADVEAARMHAVKFESTANVTWRLAGYDADIVDRGNISG